MSTKAGVYLTIKYGQYGEQQKTVAVDIGEDLMQELTQTVELSDEPVSVLLASPGVFGGKGDAVTIRRKVFQMRRVHAEDIARKMIPAILESFGVNDKLDGYRVSAMLKEEIEWHKNRGRLGS